jgi:hypothetical protein
MAPKTGHLCAKWVKCHAQHVLEIARPEMLEDSCGDVTTHQSEPLVAAGV